MNQENIWTAASEGDAARVAELVESGLSPSIPDENTYTPLHAAASYSHTDILRYLVSKGGDINTVDGDGETPLFLVETAETARVVVELGGDPRWKNVEGMTPAESLQEEYPHISLYLRSLTGETAPITLSEQDPSPDLDTPTDSLLHVVRSIMEASERGELSAEETDDKLREVVERAVKGQVEVGRELGMEEGEESGRIREREDANGDERMEDGAGKRRREEPGR